MAFLIACFLHQNTINSNYFPQNVKQIFTTFSSLNNTNQLTLKEMCLDYHLSKKGKKTINALVLFAFPIKVKRQVWKRSTWHLLIVLLIGVFKVFSFWLFVNVTSSLNTRIAEFRVTVKSVDFESELN